MSSHIIEDSTAYHALIKKIEDIVAPWLNVPAIKNRLTLSAEYMEHVSLNLSDISKWLLTNGPALIQIAEEILKLVSGG
jgi:hypothetical protein